MLPHDAGALRGYADADLARVLSQDFAGRRPKRAQRKDRDSPVIHGNSCDDGCI